MWKHCRNGKVHTRQFFITKDLKYLGWRAPSNEPFDITASANSMFKHNYSYTTVPLNVIHSIILGKYTKVFKKKKQNNNAKEFYQSFSFVSDERTIDVVAETTF